MTAQRHPKAPKFAVSNLDPKAVIADYLGGKKTTQIAKELGISRQALNAWLLRVDIDGWHTAQTAIAQEDLEEAQDYRAQTREALKKASKEERERLNIALACARDAEKSAQWRLERVNRRIYGADGGIVVSAEALGDMLMRVSSKMLEEKQLEALPGDNKE